MDPYHKIQGYFILALISDPMTWVRSLRKGKLINSIWTFTNHLFTCVLRTSTCIYITNHLHSSHSRSLVKINSIYINIKLTGTHSNMRVLKASEKSCRFIYKYLSHLGSLCGLMHSTYKCWFHLLYFTVVFAMKFC